MLNFDLVGCPIGIDVMGHSVVYVMVDFLSSWQTIVQTFDILHFSVLFMVVINYDQFM